MGNEINPQKHRYVLCISGGSNVDGFATLIFWRRPRDSSVVDIYSWIDDQLMTGETLDSRTSIYLRMNPSSGWGQRFIESKLYISLKFVVATKSKLHSSDIIRQCSAIFVPTCWDFKSPRNSPSQVGSSQQPGSDDLGICEFYEPQSGLWHVRFCDGLQRLAPQQLIRLGLGNLLIVVMLLT